MAEAVAIEDAPQRPPPAWGDLVDAPEFKQLPIEEQSHAVEAWRETVSSYGKSKTQWNEENESELGTFTNAYQAQLEQNVKFTPDQPAFKHLANKILFDPERPADGMIGAYRAGLIPQPDREKLRNALVLQDSIRTQRELEERAGGGQVAKAAALGAGRGAAFLAGGAATVAGLAPLNAAITAAGTPLAGGAAVLLEGLAGGMVAGAAYDQLVTELGENSKAIASASAAAELHPVASMAGEFVAFGAAAPLGIARGIKRFQLVAENLGKREAVKQAAQYVAVSGGIGAVSAPITTAVENFKNAALEFGGEQADLFDPTNIAANTVLAVMLGNLGVKFTKYNAAQAAGIHQRGMRGDKLSGAEKEVFDTINRKIAKDPSQFVFEVEQATMGGAPLGGAAAARTKPIPAQPAPAAGAPPPRPSAAPPPRMGAAPPPRPGAPPPTGTTPRKFSTQDEFNSFMNAAAARGDSETGHEAWKFNDQKWFRAWWRQNSKDPDATFFANSVISQRKNKDHAEFVRQQKSGTQQRAPDGQPAPEPTAAGTRGTVPRTGEGAPRGGRPPDVDATPAVRPERTIIPRDEGIGPGTTRGGVTPFDPTQAYRRPSTFTPEQLQKAVEDDIRRILAQTPEQTAAETANALTETPDASTILVDERPVQAPGTQQQRGEVQGRQDLQQPAPGQPGVEGLRQEAPDVQAPVAVPPADLPSGKLLTKDEITALYPSIDPHVLGGIQSAYISKRGSPTLQNGKIVARNHSDVLHEIGHNFEILVASDKTLDADWKKISSNQLPKGVWGNKPEKLRNDLHSIYENLAEAFAVYHGKAAGLPLALNRDVTLPKVVSDFIEQHSAAVKPAAPVARSFKTRPPADEFAGSSTPVAAAIINDIGGILSKSQAKKSGAFKRSGELWDDQQALSHPTHNKVFNPRGEMPDAAAQRLYDAGLINDPTVGAMWKALAAESKSARGQAREVRSQKLQAKEAGAQDKAFAKIQGKKPGEAIEAKDLNVDDVVEVGGEQFKVTAIDPDSFDVTLEDGARFGVQEIKEGEVIYGEHKPGAREEGFAPAEPEPQKPKAEAPDPAAKFKAALRAERRAYVEDVAKRPVEQQPPRMWYENEAASTRGIGPEELTGEEVRAYKQMWENARKRAIQLGKPVYALAGESVPKKGWTKEGDLWVPPKEAGASNLTATVEKNKADALMMNAGDPAKAAAWLENYAAKAKDPAVAENLRAAAESLKPKEAVEPVAKKPQHMTREEFESEPPVPKGMTRIYRGGEKGKEGQWFTEDRDIALFHMSNVENAAKARLSYVDIPTADIGKYDAFEHPSVLSGKEMAEAGDLVLPKNLTANATTLRQGESSHEILIERALEKGESVNAAAVDDYGLELPSGYSKKGNLYVKEPVSKRAKPELPKLRRGEDQGDLLATQKEDLTLVGEKGVDTLRQAEEKARAEKEAAEAKAKFDKEQANLFEQDMKRPNAGEAGGIPASLFEDALNAGKEIYGKIKDFGRWAAEMIKRFGERIALGLHRVWESVSGQVVRPEFREGGGIFSSARRRREPDAIGGASRVLTTRAFWEGSADALAKKPQFQPLAKAINKQVDLADKHIGKTAGAIERWEKTTPRGERQDAKETFERYMAARESGRTADAGRIMADASPAAEKLIKTVEEIAEYTGQVSTTLVQPNGTVGAHVLEKTATGPRGGMETHKRRLINMGKNFFPRILQPEYDAVLRDPKSDPDKWNQMVNELIANGNISTRAEADAFIKGGSDDNVATEFLGSLYRARGERLPDWWYDTSFDGFTNWATKWSDIVSKIEAFGQKLLPNDKDLWDTTLDSTTHQPTRSFIQSVQARAFNEHNAGSAAKYLLDAPRYLASGLFLTNPVTIGINAISGKVMNTFTYGLKANFGRNPLAMFSKRNNLDAHGLGILKRDMVRLLYNDDLPGLDALKNFTNKAMTLSGYRDVENLVRVDAYLTSMAFMHDGLAAVRKNPTSSASMNFLAFLKRNKHDVQGIVSDTPGARDTFIRTTIRDTQGGYAYNQVPWWTDTPMGRMMLQFSKFSTQFTRNVARNVIKPAFVGTRVSIRVGGKTVSKRVFNVKPLLYFLAGTIGGGELIAWLKDKGFGRERTDATFDEIASAMDESTRDGLALLAVRALNDMITMGALGIFGTPVQMARDVEDRSKFRNPLAPPGVSLVKNIGNLVMSGYEQGKITANDVADFLKSSVSMYRYGDAFIKEQSKNADLEWRGAEVKQRKDDLTFIRNATNRYAKEVGIEPTKFTSSGRQSKSEITPLKRELFEALSVGEVEEVKKQVAEYLKEFPSVATMNAKLDSLRDSVRNSQPIRVGGIAGTARRVDFIDWAKKKLSPADVERIRNLDSTYRTTAIEAGLMMSTSRGEELKAKYKADRQRQREGVPATEEQKTEFLERELQKQRKRRH